MADVSVGSVSVDLVPDARQFNTRMAEIARNASIAVKVDADIRTAQAKIADLGGDVSVRADADVEEARARIDEVTRTRTVRIDVDADTAGAEANIARLRDGANGAGSGLGAMASAALTLGPALIPLGAAALGAAAAFGSLGAAGLAGAGVLGIALAGVTSAVKLLNQQQTQQAAASTAAGQSAAAQAQAITSAQRQIQSAEMSLADAQRQAADQQIQDSHSVQSAQYSLAQADQQEADAVKALVSAREAASRQLESYANQAVDAGLAQKQSVLDLETAQANYAKTTDSATATDQQRQQAALDLQKAQQHVVEAQQAATNAAEENTKAQKAGVDGAPQVVSATQSVAAAQHNQQQAAQSLADAQRKADEDQIKSQESIVRAQQGVEAAMDAMAAAQRSASGGANAALAATNAQIAKLDPATRAFAEYVRGTLAPVWHGLTSTMAGGLLPGLQAGIQSWMPDLPILTRFLGNLSHAMGDLFAAAGKALTSPFWQDFFNMLADNVGPWMTALGRIFGDIVKGLAGLFQAMQPVAQMVIPWLVGLADGFARLGTSAGTSSAFQKVIEYIKQAMPIVGQVFRDLFTAVGHIIEALAPIGPPLIGILDAVIRAFNRIPIHILTDVALGIMGIVAAQKLISPLQSMFGAVAGLSPWMIALALAATAIGLVYANSKTFRDFIANDVIPTLKSWGDWIMQNVVPALLAVWDWIVHKLVPVLVGIFMAAWNGITDAVHIVSDAIKHNQGALGDIWNVISGFIGFIVRDVLPILGPILRGVFDLIGVAIAGVITAIGWLVDAWKGLGTAFTWVNDHVIHPIWVGFIDAVHWVRDTFKAAVDDIAGIWDTIKHALLTPVQWVIDIIWNDGLRALWNGINNIWGGTDIQPFKLGLADGGVVGFSGGRAVAMATGGVLPGYTPGRDVHTFVSPTGGVLNLSGGEAVMRPEFTAALGPASIEALNRLAATQGAAGVKHALRLAAGGVIPTQSFAGGGIVGLGDRSLAGLVGNPVVQFLTAAVVPGGALVNQLEDYVSKESSLTKNGGDTPIFSMLGDMIRNGANSIWDTIKGAVGNFIAPGGGGYAKYLTAQQAAAIKSPLLGSPGLANFSLNGGVLQWLPIVDQVLALLGLPQSVDSGVLNLIMHESGGNPNAINLTDSNARAGHPSQGLMQTIPSTFYAYAGPYASRGITDPLANIYAGVNYALHTYGVGMLAAGGRKNAAGQYIGYDAGGLLETGPSLVYNGTGQPEIVVPRQTFDQVMSGASGGAGPASFTGNLYLDSGEFLGKVRGEAATVVTGALNALHDRGQYSS